MLGTSPAATACQQRRHRRRSAIARRRHIPAASAMGCAESVLWKAALTPVRARCRGPRALVRAPLLWPLYSWVHREVMGISRVRAAGEGSWIVAGAGTLNLSRLGSAAGAGPCWLSWQGRAETWPKSRRLHRRQGRLLNLRLRGARGDVAVGWPLRQEAWL